MRRDSRFLAIPALLGLLAGLSFARPSDAAPGTDAAQATPSESIPEGFIARGAIHRLMLAADSALLAELETAGALLRAEHHGSFVYAKVDTQRTEGLAALLARGALLADEQTLINLNGYLLDGANGLATRAVLDTIPANLRGPTDPPADGERRLRIVQFDGPIRDAWLEELRATGAFIVTYIPNNAYVVVADPQADGLLAKLRAREHVLAITTYEPAFKLRSELRPPTLLENALQRLVVQVIADGEGDAFVARLLQREQLIAEPWRILDYINVELYASGATALALARDSHVFAVEPKLNATLCDEAQGQLMANNLNAGGTAPSGPGYLTWLQGLGFPGAGANPFSFSVDVVDDGVDKGSTTDVNVEFRVDGVSSGASRYAYSNNYSGDALGDSQAGHGNINASIIGGYNNLTGSAYEDASGYNYGLGIAPWVKIGNSKVFNNAGSGIFNQSTPTRMQNAWNGGARISSNSWGYTSGSDYNSDSQAHDSTVRDAASGTTGNQEMTIVFAAGNDGSGTSTIHPPGTGKNVITVGAGENFRQTGTDGCAIANSGADNCKDIISFSSRGPCSDSRKKPDLMAPGTHIQGAASRATGYNGSGVCNKYWPSGQTLYCWSSGTSHSTPAAAGACALLRQWFTIKAWGTPTPAMQKAFLASTATHMTGVGANDTLPSNSQGMGRINLGRSFDAASRVMVDQTTVLGATGNTYTASGSIASSAEPFRVALAWTDVPGPTTGNAYVNNLDLEVTINSTLYRGNVFSGAGSITGGTADVRNNLECVFLPAGTTGSWSITVKATNIAGDGVPGNADTTDQDFALVVYNGNTTPPPADFSLAATPSSQTITQGSPTSYTVTSTPSGGFSGNITLSATPPITGVTYSFSPNPIGASGTSTLSVTTTSSATVGTHTVTITGISGTLTHTAVVTLIINAAGGNPVKTYSAAPNLAIPDNNSTGVTSTINVGTSLTVTSIAISTVITHTYKGDLVVTLTGPDGTSAILHNRTGTSTDNVSTTFSIVTTSSAALTVFNGKNTSGNWSVKVQDLAATDTGTFNSWAITFNGEQKVSPNLSIPDNNTTGVTSSQAFNVTGTVASVKLRVDVTHTYKGDLELSLIAPDGTTVIVHNRTGGATDNIQTEYPDITVPYASLSAFTGKLINGNWSLKARDLAASDTGKINSWTLSLTAQ
ncbi:MAG: hypothetical protein EXS13_07910 [Planctomycetes bacterium]|nr:hypothetical protein [Planctomycetota bacterium]